MATPDTKNSIVIVKQMGYRGSTRTFSNRYHFEGDLPTDFSSWAAFADLIVDAEKAIYPSGVEIIEAIGYDAATATSTNPHGDSVFSKTYTTAGTGSFESTGTRMPGDCAGLVRYSTAARSAKNHPIYLMNYYHGVYCLDGAQDTLDSTQKTAYEGYADAWVTGFLADGTHRERCGPRGAVSTGRRVDPSVRHRDFPN